MASQPAGLLRFLESSETIRASEEDRLNTRDNLKLASTAHAANQPSQFAKQVRNVEKYVEKQVEVRRYTSNGVPASAVQYATPLTLCLSFLGGLEALAPQDGAGGTDEKPASSRRTPETASEPESGGELGAAVSQVRKGSRSAGPDLELPRKRGAERGPDERDEAVGWGPGSRGRGDLLEPLRLPGPVQESE